MALNILIVVVLFSCILLINEGLYRKRVLGRETARKATHIVCGTLTLWTTQILPFSIIAVIAAFFAAVLFLLHGTPHLGSVTMSDRRTHGEWLLPLGFAVIAVLFPTPAVFLPAVAIATYADAFAGIAGAGSAKKTARGSIVFFVVSALILALSFGMVSDFSFDALFRTIAVAAILTVIERFALSGTDNLLLPLTAAVLLSLV